MAKQRNKGIVEPTDMGGDQAEESGLGSTKSGRPAILVCLCFTHRTGLIMIDLSLSIS